MLLYVIVIFGLALIGLKVDFKGIHPDYMSKDSANAIKGIFILLIFASHFCNPISKTFTAPMDIAYRWVRTFLGQLVVAMFLFYSGFGVFKSITEKDTYVGRMLKHRILPVLLIYDLSQLIFFLIQSALGKTYTLNDIVLSLLAWKSFGNDNWYIFVILCLYFISFVAAKCSRKISLRLAVISVLSLLLIVVLKEAGKAAHWYNTIMCFSLGAGYYAVKAKIDEYVDNIIYILLVICVFAGFLVAHHFWYINVWIYNITAMLFAVLCVLLSMKIKISNTFLKYCGEHLQGLFLVHRVPMILLGAIPAIKNGNMYIYFCLFVVLSFVAEYFFNILVTFLRGSHR